MSLSAIATSAHETISPVDSRRSTSRSTGEAATLRDSANRSSVESPMAEQTTTTPVSADFDAVMRRATPRIFSGSARELPPYFCTMTAMRDISPVRVFPYPFRLSMGVIRPCYPLDTT